MWCRSVNNQEVSNQTLSVAVIGEDDLPGKMLELPVDHRRLGPVDHMVLLGRNRRICFQPRWMFVFDCVIDTVGKTSGADTMSVKQMRLGFPVVFWHYRLSGRKDIWLIKILWLFQ